MGSSAGGPARLLGLAWLVAASAAAAQSPPTVTTTKRILLLQQSSVGAPARTSFDVGFVEAMRSFPVDLYAEVIENNRFPGAGQRQLDRDYLAGKYAGRRIDVIVTVGVEPLTFARQNGEIFGSPPIVAIVNTAGYLDRGDDVTGLQARRGVEGTIDLALALRPGTRKLYAIDGARANNGVVEAELRRQMAGRPGLELIHLRDLPVSEVAARVAAAPDDAVVLFWRQTMRDAAEDMGQSEALAQIARASRVPVFSESADFVGHGSVGGYVWRSEVDARRVAELARRIASGERARDIPVQDATHENVVDWQEMQRWSLPASSLPGTIVLSRPTTFLEQYRRLALGGAVVFLVQSALIVGLFVQRRRRRQAEAESLSRGEALGIVEARNSAMLRAIPDLMFVLLRDGTFVDFHARDPDQLFVAPKEFMGRNVRDVMPPPLDRIMMEAITAACAAEPDDPVIVEYELPMAEPRHFEARLVRVGHDRVLSIVRDVTDAKGALALNQRLTGQLITAQENERARIARYLHDGVCQEVASVAVDVSYVRLRGGGTHRPEMEEILLAVERRAAGVAETLRRLSHDLHPSVLQHLGLTAAMRAHCDELVRRHQLTITVTADDDCRPPHRMTELSLFRIMQEALHNAVEHGRARRAVVSLSRTADRLTLTVTDDGSGFDVAAWRARSGLGLVSIEERARLAGGRVQVRSEPGRGTTIEADVPFDLEAGSSSPSTETESNGLGLSAPVRGSQPPSEELVTAGDAASQRE